MSREEPAFKIKNANIQWFILHIHTTDMEKMKTELTARMTQAADFFINTPLVLGLTPIANSADTFDLNELITFMRSQNMQAAGVVGGSPAQRDTAVAAGLRLFPDLEERRPNNTENKPNAPAEELPSPVPVHSANLKATIVIDKPVRAGQRIYAEGANLVVLAIVNAGAELIADGDIHVYAPLRGRAIAGAHGNPYARIFVQQMEAELLSIDGIFQNFENGIPEQIKNKALHIHLDGTRLIMDNLIG